MDKNKIHIQLVWGTLLVLAGIGVFFRIPQVMPKIKTIEYFSSVIWFIYICFYLLGILLIMGGGRKIWENYRKLKGKDSYKDSSDNNP
jgi:cobalamin biosynthesis protein CobD/CbiB